MKKPDNSIEFIVEWFEKAVENSIRLGKADSAALWRDGLAILRYFEAENKKLKQELEDLKDKKS